MQLCGECHMWLCHKQLIEAACCMHKKYDRQKETKVEAQLFSMNVKKESLWT